MSRAYPNTRLRNVAADMDHAARAILWDSFIDDDYNKVRAGGGITALSRDARGRLVGINGYMADCTALTASFKYDALNRRVEKTINGKTTTYLYDGFDIIQEMENGMVSADYIRTLNIDEPLARIKADGTVRYYHQDHLGSVTALSDENGMIKTRYAYSPFGEVSISGEASDQPFQYTGRENDGTGYYYYRARYYSPSLKRFISEDPIGFSGGVNFYAYVGGNPVNARDPMGENAVALGGAVVVTTLVAATAAYTQSPAGQEAIRDAYYGVKDALFGNRSDEFPVPPATSTYRELRHNAHHPPILICLILQRDVNIDTMSVRPPVKPQAKELVVN